MKRMRRSRLLARRGTQGGLGGQRAPIAAIADSERARHMALPQGIRGRGSRPRGCSGIDGSEHLHRVNRIHLASRARTQNILCSS